MRADSAPKVSVVVVSYNHAPYLRDAVDSVLGQTFDDCEVVIVDDGSGDGSADLADGLAARHPQRVRVLHHPDRRNLGISRTYRLGIEAARGAYVAFLEGDDRWAPDYLGGKVALLDRHPDVGVVFSRYRILSDGLYGRDMALRQWLLGPLPPRARPFRNLTHLMKRNNVATFSAFVTRTSLLGAIPLAVPPDILYFDWWVLLQLGMRCRFLLDPAGTVEWRQYPGSALGRQRWASHQAMLTGFMRVVYDEIGRNMDLLDAREQAAFRKRKATLPHFLRFYEQPCVRRFADFLGRDPLWAMESLASCGVNRWKFRA